MLRDRSLRLPPTSSHTVVHTLVGGGGLRAPRVLDIRRPPAQHRAACCESPSHSFIFSFLQMQRLSNLLSKVLGSQGLRAPTAVPPVKLRMFLLMRRILGGTFFVSKFVCKFVFEKVSFWHRFGGHFGVIFRHFWVPDRSPTPIFFKNVDFHENLCFLA